MIAMWLYRRWRRRSDERAALAGVDTVATEAVPTRLGETPRNTGAPGMVLHQARYELLGVWRNGQARFFTLILPLLFLVIFVSVFGNDNVGPHHVKGSTYYVPGLAAMGVIGASFVNLVIWVTTDREMGVFKRRRATPVQAWVLVAARTLTSVVVSLSVMTVLLLVGRIFYGTYIAPAAIPAIAVTGLLGAVCFCVLGYALTTFIHSVDAAQPMVQAIMLPLYFISGVFIPNVSLPTWLQNLARFFPVQHLADGLHNAFDPSVHGSAFVASDISSLLIWTAVGLFVALRRFSWVPASAGAAA